MAAGKTGSLKSSDISVKIKFVFNQMFRHKGGKVWPDAQRLGGHSQSIAQFYIFSIRCFPPPRSDHKISDSSERFREGGNIFSPFF